MPPRCPRRDSLSDLSNYSTRRIQPVRQVHVVRPARCSSSVEPPGSFPENSVRADSPSQINVLPTPFTSFSSPPSRSPSPTSSQPLLVHFQPASPSSPLTPTTPQVISVAAPLTPIFVPPVFTLPMTFNPAGAAQAPRAQAVVSMPAHQARDALKFDASKPQELKRYFSELEIHLRAAGISDDQDRKAHAI